MSEKILVLVVGPQGAGKSTLYKEEFSSFMRISQDDQGKEGHKYIFDNAIKYSLSIYVDRINHTRDARERYLKPAKEAGYKTKIIVLQESYGMCYQRILARKNHPTLAAKPEQAHSALSTYFFQFQKPHKSEADELEFRGKDQNFFLDLTEECKDKRVFIVGDVHGTYHEFIRLMEKSSYNPAEDILIFTGDLVDRGPGIDKIIIWHGINKNAYSVMGNHEYKFVRYLLGRKVHSHSLRQTIEQTKNFDKNHLINQVMSMPFCIKFRENAYVVHAGINTLKPIMNQYKDELFYTRNLTINGVDAPWWNSYYGEDEIYFGHEVTPQGIQVADKVFAMDGGACFGLELRVCVNYPDGKKEFFTEKCETRYAEYYGAEEDGETSQSKFMEAFENKVKDGYVNKKTYKDLVLYNYTPKCVYEKKWDTITRKARGIIFDKVTGELVTKTPDKFFNVNEMPETLFENLPISEGYDVYEKVDGSFVSLGYWKRGNEWIFATRGSFESEQAKQATEMFTFYSEDSYRDVHMLNKNYCYIFEVIYPENRHNEGARLVVDYGNVRCLIGLLIFDKVIGEELPYQEAYKEFIRLGIVHAKKLNHNIDELPKLQKTLSSQEEGFVVLFKNGLRVKFKTEEYIKMNRILNSINIKTVWESMENGKVSENFIMNIPEELRELVEGYKKELEEHYQNVYNEAVEEQKSILPSMTDFKTIGLFLKDNSKLFKYPGLVFPIIRGLDYASIIHQIIRPRLG